MIGSMDVTDERVRAAASGSERELPRILEAMAPQIRIMVAARLGATGSFSELPAMACSVGLALRADIPQQGIRTVAALRAHASELATRIVAEAEPGGEGMASAVTAPLPPDSTLTCAEGATWTFLSAARGTAGAVPGVELARRTFVELGRLEREYREVITLALFDRLPIEEVARRLGCTRMHASRLLILAVQELRRRLNDPGPGERDHG